MTDNNSNEHIGASNACQRKPNPKPEAPKLGRVSTSSPEKSMRGSGAMMRSLRGIRICRANSCGFQFLRVRGPFKEAHVGRFSAIMHLMAFRTVLLDSLGFVAASRPPRPERGGRVSVPARRCRGGYRRRVERSAFR